jgi:hypothetical protein
MVARDDRVAWSTAFWFWKKNVKKLEGINKGLFGYSTLMINGNILNKRLLYFYYKFIKF